MPTWNKISDEKRVEIWRAWKEEKLTGAQLAARFKYHVSSIWRAVQIERKKRHPKVLIINPVPVSTALALRPKNNGHVPHGNQHQTKWGHLAEEIKQLHAAGMKPRDISAKLGIPKPALAHYIYGAYSYKKRHEEATVVDGKLNRNIAVGIVYAETERFLSALAERLGVPTTILRPKLSELLGRSPFR